MAAPIEPYRTITPYLVVPDAEAEIRFLQSAFGAVVTLCHRSPEDRIMHAELNIGDAQVMLGQAGGEWQALPAALYVWVPDVDATYDRALAAGATSLSGPENKDYGHRNAGVLDPNRITWWIGSPLP